MSDLKIYDREHPVEAKLEKLIRLKYHGYVIKNQASATTGEGKPDLSACINGKYYGIEVKRTNSRVKTTKAQLINLQKIALAGGIALYAKSFKLDLLIEEKLPIEEIDFDIFDPLKQIQHLLNLKNVLFIRYCPEYLLLYQEKENL